MAAWVAYFAFRLLYFFPVIQQPFFRCQPFFVNVVGCFLIGLFYAMTLKYTSLAVEWRLFLITGFCGGFTTFSAFAYENIMLLQKGDTMLFMLYSIGSFAVTLLAVAAGMYIVKSS